MKNSADLGGCYPPWPSASVDSTLRDLQNSSYPTKAEFNISNYWTVLLKQLTDPITFACDVRIQISYTVGEYC